MTITRTVLVTLARLGVGFLAIVVAAGCSVVAGTSGTSQLSPSLSVTTLMPGWDRKFALDWQATPESGGTQRVHGHLVSTYGRTAEPVRLLVQGLDTSGALVDQRIAWVPGGVGALGSAYFEILHLPAADHYRMTIWDYSIPGAGAP
jgi:hypothetical protein